jgi:hypothetical protein
LPPQPDAGITIGSVAAVHGYVTQLLASAYKEASPKCRKYGADQAVHNYLLHYLGPRGRLPFAYHMHRNWDSPVHTAGAAPAAGLVQRGGTAHFGSAGRLPPWQALGPALASTVLLQAVSPGLPSSAYCLCTRFPPTMHGLMP